MIVGEKLIFWGPYLPPNQWFRGVLMLGFGLSGLWNALSLWGKWASFGITLSVLVFALPLCVFGIRNLYKAITRTPSKVAYFTLSPDGLLSAWPGPKTPPIEIPWDAMRRIEPAAADSSPLRLHFFAGNVTHDEVPAIGHKINEKIFGNIYREYKAKNTFEAHAQVVELEPDAMTVDGAMFGDQFPVWFAKYATQADAR